MEIKKYRSLGTEREPPTSTALDWSPHCKIEILNDGIKLYCVGSA
jgi:hypothetical protein